jgi:hypothetical protein
VNPKQYKITPVKHIISNIGTQVEAISIPIIAPVDSPDFAIFVVLIGFDLTCFIVPDANIPSTSNKSTNRKSLSFMNLQVCLIIKIAC